MHHLLTHWILTGALSLGLVVAAAASPSAAPADPETDAAPRAILIERIEVTGNTRTATEVVLEHLDLGPGDPADPIRIRTAAAALEGVLFREVTAHTRPGSRPGRLIVVLAVKENRAHVRFGAGNEDLSGWYLIPVRLDLDNLTGHGETVRLDTRFGYRTSALVLEARTARPDRRVFGDLRLHAGSEDRIYYLDDTEVNQRLERGGLELGIGVPAGGGWLMRGHLGFESVEADSEAVVYRDREILGRERGDTVPFDELPTLIRESVGRRDQTRLGASVELDRRDGVGLGTSGIRGRVRVEGVFSPEADFLDASVDLRGYRAIAPRLQLAARIQARTVGAEAPFYERQYLGGLYTVRGFPSQSLSPPEGDRHLVAGSVEVRAPWIGPAGNPRVTGLLFLDLGSGWGSRDGRDEPRGPNDRTSRSDVLSLGVGYGIRVRVPWLQQIGIDVGFPVTDPDFDVDAFHVNGSLGWTF